MQFPHYSYIGNNDYPGIENMSFVYFIDEEIW